MTWKIYMAEVLRVRVDVLNKNGSVESLLENPDQIILLDTNFIITYLAPIINLIKSCILFLL